jgi:hypothetical protein
VGQANSARPPHATIRTYKLIDQWSGRDEPVVNTQELARECEAAMARVAGRVCYVLVGSNRLRFNLGTCRLKWGQKFGHSVLFWVFAEPK